MPIVFYAFAFLVVSGGAMGTVKSHEPWSIIGSTIFGVVAVIGGVMMKRNPRRGLTVGLIDATLFFAFFAWNFAKSGKSMPAVPSMGMGAIVIVLAAMALTKLGKGTA